MTPRTSFFLAIALAACTSGSRDNGRSQPATGTPEASVKTAGAAAVAATDRMTMERGPCYGTCPVFTIDIAGDGAVTFEGRQHVLKTGRVEGRVPATLASSLLRQAESIGVSRMADAYKEGTSACGGYVTDLPTVTLWVRRSGSTKVIAADYGCSGMPRALRPLHARLDSVARALRWIPAE